MQVEASVDEADIGGISEGDKVTFSVDAFPDDIFNGIIQQIRLNPITTNNVVTYTTIIKTSNESLKLKPGMTANITIYTKEVDNAALIPVKAIKFSPDSAAGSYQILPSGHDILQNENSVWVKQGNQLIQKVIKTGLNNNIQVEVLDGLATNDDVVTGLKQTGTSGAANLGNPSSPFMPKRPGGDKNKKK